MERSTSLLPEGNELSASSQVVCGDASQLSRFTAAAGGVRNRLSLRAERRAVRTDARALAPNERRPHLLHAGTIRGPVQRGERNVSELLQAVRDREIFDAFLNP